MARHDPVHLRVAALLLCVFSGGCAWLSSTAGSQRDYEIGVGRVAGLGRVLVDARGMTLYIYTPDQQGRTRCTGLCEQEWTPLLATDSRRSPSLGTGVDPALVGTVRRPDGSLQLTYDRWPLYAYRLDSPAEASGEQVDMGLWLVMTPNGKPGLP